MVPTVWWSEIWLMKAEPVLLENFVRFCSVIPNLDELLRNYDLARLLSNDLYCSFIIQILYAAHQDSESNHY